jgi:hypothetical protein
MMALRLDRGNRRTRMRGGNAGTVQLRRVCGRRNGGMAVITVERQRRIFRRHLHVLRLLRRRRHVLLTGGGNLLWRRPHRGAAGTAIVAHVGRVVDDDGLVVDVGDRRVRDVVDAAVVEESAAAPIAALVADAGIAVAIRDAAVEADFRTPIAIMKGIDAVVPAPISWRPQQLRFRRHSSSPYRHSRPNSLASRCSLGPGSAADRKPATAAARYRQLCRCCLQHKAERPHNTQAKQRATLRRAPVDN